MEEAKRLAEVLPGEWTDMVRVCLYTGGQRLGDIAKLKGTLKNERVLAGRTCPLLPWGRIPGYAPVPVPRLPRDLIL